MCGLAGLALRAGAPPPDPAVLARLQTALAHRGPDGASQTVLGQAALVHTRLAVIDVAGGDQPFHEAGATLVANGEVYNAPELRQAMPDTRFATGSDCEPPLHLFHADAAGFAAPLRGMYAIAVAHDPAGRGMTLARDPFGIKPLYYASMPDGLAFASEPQALVAAGLVARGLHAPARDALLRTQFSPGASTIFPGISRVLPGETLRIEDGAVVARATRPALEAGGPEPIDEAAALTRLDAALMDSVAVHCRSDVPYGLFLSGGVDSASVLAAMARLGDRPLAFTAGFDVPGAADERAQAASVARAAGSRHEVLTITRDMVWRHLPRIVACMDDPAADYAIIPSWFLARHARAQVKVVLCGEGGDEIFGGYGRYRRAMRPWFLGGRAMRARGTFDGLDVLRVGPAPRAGRAGVSNGRSRLQAAQAADMADWLPHDLLLKLDRCLMAHGVEGRTPFLDQAVARAGFRLPDRLKVRRGQGKYLLRRWLEGALPASRPFAPKQGFTVPVGAWIAAEGARLGRRVAAQPGVAEIARPDRVAALFEAAQGRREGFAAWTLLFYALWHRAHVEGLDSEGGVAETL